MLLAASTIWLIAAVTAVSDSAAMPRATITSSKVKPAERRRSERRRFIRIDLEFAVQGHFHPHFGTVGPANEAQVKRRHFAAGKDQHMRQVALAFPIPGSLLDIGVRGFLGKRDRPVLEEQLELHAFFQRTRAQQLIADNFMPLVERGVMFHEAVAMLHE